MPAAMQNSRNANRGNREKENFLKTDSSISGVYGAELKKQLLCPIYPGGVSAGFPSPAEDYTDRKLDLNELLIHNQAATFFVRVDGDSMINAGIQHNDILVVDRSREAVNNDIVIAILDGELTVKRLVRNSSQCRLVAENPDYPSIEISRDDTCEIWGVVSSVVHQF
jgi:DNA polymerase V